MQIDDLRKQIDIVDNKIAQLLQQRAEIVEEITELKIEKNMSMIDEDREKAILYRVQQKCRNPLSSITVETIFRTIIQESRRIQSAVIMEKSQIKS